MKVRSLTEPVLAVTQENRPPTEPVPEAAPENWPPTIPVPEPERPGGRRRRFRLHHAARRIPRAHPVTEMLRNAIAASRRGGKLYWKTVKQKAIDVHGITPAVKKLLAESGGRCAVTGVVFDYSDPKLVPSLDRKDSDIGYDDPNNVQITTVFYNETKKDLPDADFMVLMSRHFGPNTDGKQQ